MIPQDTTEIIWAFSGTVVGLIICVAISAIVRQIRHNSTGSTQADRWDDATSAVMGFVTGEAARSERFSKLLKREDTRSIVIEAFCNVARANPESAKALRHRSEDVALLRKWVSDSLDDKEPGRRANACEVVGTLRLRACHGMVLAATGDADANVRVSATRALCVLDPETAVGVLLGLIERDGSWAADLLADLLQRVPQKAMAAVMQRAREWGATPALVKLLASCPSEVANTVLLGSLETDSPELRARVAEAIQASSPQAIASLAALLTDPHEGTRLSAVRSLGRARNPKALITLSSALSDSSRLVRFAAAEGIAATPSGANLLSRIVAGVDKNAAEAAELALWRLQTESISDAEPPGVAAFVAPGEFVACRSNGEAVSSESSFVGQVELHGSSPFELALASLLDEAANEPVAVKPSFQEWEFGIGGGQGWDHEPAWQ
jgi:HEAT repeats